MSREFLVLNLVGDSSGYGRGECLINPDHIVVVRPGDPAPGAQWTRAPYGSIVVTSAFYDVGSQRRSLTYHVEEDVTKVSAMIASLGGSDVDIVE